MNNRRTKQLPKIIMTQLGVGAIMALVGLYVLFLAEGYQFNIKRFNFIKTGIIAVSAFPYDSKVYLNGKLVHQGSFLNRSGHGINLTPGYYDIRVEKEGYSTWQKNVKVEVEKVNRFSSVVLFLVNAPVSDISDQKKINLINNPSDVIANKQSSDTLIYLGPEIWIGNKLITRFSSPVLNAAWYPDKDHIVFQQGKEIKAMDSDGSNIVKLVTLGTNQAEKFIVSNNREELYFSDEGKYKAARIR